MQTCNSAFATIGLDLNLKKYASLADDMLFNKNLPTSLTTNKSRFSLGTDASTGEIMQTAIGQGKTLVTPLHMAMIAGAVDNGGVVMKPYIIDRIENDGGIAIRNYKPSEYGSIISEKEAGILQGTDGRSGIRGHRFRPGQDRAMTRGKNRFRGV